MSKQVMLRHQASHDTTPLLQFLCKIITTSFCDQNFYVGIDVHKKSWSISVCTSGIEVEHFTQQPDPADLRQGSDNYKN